MRDPRCEHEYLNRLTKKTIFEQVSDDNEEDERDKHLEARDHG